MAKANGVDSVAFINFGRKEIAFKIVYYGPARSGKTTNLEQLHAFIRRDSRGELTTIATEQDRTLFFDFLPLQSNIIKGFTSKFQLYTVPGQSIYSRTRRLVLQRTDGVVFVADSQWTKMAENVESFEDLARNLKAHEMSVDSLPLVLQFNKRDVDDIAPEHYMNFLLNRRETRVPVMSAVATRPEGVFETLNLISRMTLSAFARRHNLTMTDTTREVCVDADERKESCLQG